MLGPKFPYKSSPTFFSALTMAAIVRGGKKVFNTLFGRGGERRPGNATELAREGILPGSRRSSIVSESGSARQLHTAMGSERHMRDISTTNRLNLPSALETTPSRSPYVTTNTSNPFYEPTTRNRNPQQLTIDTNVAHTPQQQQSPENPFLTPLEEPSPIVDFPYRSPTGSEIERMQHIDLRNIPTLHDVKQENTAQNLLTQQARQQEAARLANLPTAERELELAQRVRHMNRETAPPLGSQDIIAVERTLSHAQAAHDLNAGNRHRTPGRTEGVAGSRQGPPPTEAAALANEAATAGGQPSLLRRVLGSTANTAARTVSELVPGVRGTGLGSGIGDIAEDIVGGGGGGSGGGLGTPPATPKPAERLNKKQIAANIAGTLLATAPAIAIGATNLAHNNNTSSTDGGNDGGNGGAGGAGGSSGTGGGALGYALPRGAGGYGVSGGASGAHTFSSSGECPPWDPYCELQGRNKRQRLY